MLAKLTSKNQITIPKSVISAFQGTEYFDVAEDDGRIVLAPVQASSEGAPPERVEALIKNLERLQIPNLNIADAEEWARNMDPAQAKAVWEKIERLGITEQDVADAVEWARRG